MSWREAIFISSGSHHDVACDATRVHASIDGQMDMSKQLKQKTNMTKVMKVDSYTGCSKSHAPSLTRYIFRYENSIAMKEVCLNRVTLHNCCDTKHCPIDDLVTYLSKLKWISSKYTNTYLKDPYLYF